jgi:hypothetical protein
MGTGRGGVDLDVEGVIVGVRVAVAVAVAVALAVALPRALAVAVDRADTLHGTEAEGTGAVDPLGLVLALADGVAGAQAGKHAVRCDGGVNTQATCVSLASAVLAAESVYVATGAGAVASASPAAVYTPSCQPSSAASVLAMEAPA